MKRLIVPIFIPFQGCPERCVYCDQGTITGEGEISVLPDREKIEEEVQKYLSYTKSKHEIEIAFYGGTFTALPVPEQEQLLEIAQNNSIQKPETIRVSTHPSYISHEIVQHLKNSGVSTVELGVQSMEKAVLHNLRRDYSPETVIDAIKLLKKEGLQSGSQLMAGCPGETQTGFLKGLEELVEAGNDFFRLYPLQVFPKTALAAMIRDEKLLLPDEESTLSILEGALIYLELHNKPVIRVGLPESGVPSPSLLYDPSLKHRLLSRIALKLMQEVIRELQNSSHCVISRRNDEKSALDVRDSSPFGIRNDADVKFSEKSLNSLGNSGCLTFHVNEKKLPEYIGHKKENISALNNGFHGKNIRIQCDNSTNFDELALETETGVNSFSRRELLATLYRSFT